MAAAGDDSKSIYAKHRFGPHEIRLIHLQSSTRLEERVIATISVVSLDNSAKFHSISYAWGSAIYDDYIICDGLRLPVTANLHAGLKRIREKMAVRDEDWNPRRSFLATVWADAICIDQSNNAEKSRQVQDMAKVYLKAISLTVWLGVASDHEGADVCASLEGFKRPEEASSILQTLIQRPWFTRRWIVQEAFSNRDRTVLLGGAMFPLDALRGNAEKLGRLDPGTFLRAVTDKNAFVRAMVDYITMWPKPKENMPQLMNNLIAFRSSVCADPLDSVYALLSISRDDPELLKVDYSIPTHRLYRNLAQHYYNEGWKNELEDDCGSDGRNLFRKSLVMATTTAYLQQTSLPSWVTDWAIEPRYRSPEHDRLAEMCFDGDDIDLALGESSADVALHGDELHLTGWIFTAEDQGGISFPCEQTQTTLQPFTKSWPAISAAEGKTFFYVKGWNFAFTLLPSSDDGRYRLASCFLIYDLVPTCAGVDEMLRVNDERIEFLVGFGRALRREGVRTVRIV